MRKRQVAPAFSVDGARAGLIEVCVERLTATCFSTVGCDLPLPFWPVARVFRLGATIEGFAWQFPRALEPVTPSSLIP